VHDGERLKDAEVAAEQFTPIFTSPNDPAREELVSRLEQAGFVAGYADELRSTRTGGDGGSIVLRLGSADGARALVDWVFRQGIKPCPGVCDVQIEAVEGADIPGARGIHRSRAKTTENGQGFDLELIAFADGPFLYGIAANGPPKTIDESQFVHGAERLYERVKGHPPA
jgi:hypothetical protein